MKSILLATALCAASTLSFAQTAGGPAGNGATGNGAIAGRAFGTPGTDFSGSAGTDVTGTVTRGGGLRQNDAVNEPIRRCDSMGDLSQPSRFGPNCQ
jgi:hypothetical protein